MDKDIRPRVSTDRPLSCSSCGSWLVTDTVLCSSDYIGTDVCYCCTMDHCLHTNCLDCSWGQYPGCEYFSRKQYYMNYNDEGEQHEQATSKDG